MIIFGTGGRTTVGRQVGEIHCPQCGKFFYETIVEFRYIHLFWIPVFPTERKIYISCNHCEQTQEENSLPESSARDLRRSMFVRKQSIPMFAGSFILAIILVVSIISGSRIAERERNYLGDPHLADIYVVNLPMIIDDADKEYPYGVFRVIAVSPAFVECQIGKLIYDLQSGPSADIKDHKTDSDDYYENSFVEIRRDALLEMKRDGAIEKVRRPSD